MSADMTPAETLRAAAGRLRERAEVASQPGATARVPWHVEVCTDGCACIVAEGLTSHHNEPSVPDRYIADAETPELGAWIALMHPGVGVALAGWLEHFAASEFDPEAGIQVTDASHERALSVARAVLGEEAQR